MKRIQGIIGFKIDTKIKYLINRLLIRKWIASKIPQGFGISYMDERLLVKNGLERFC
jgi:hypothetical protein